MNRRTIAAIALGVALGVAARPAGAEQLGKLGGALKRAQQFKDVEMSDAEEAQLGAEVSQRIRARYGVVQSQAVHKLRGPRRHRAGPDECQARTGVDVHRARHRCGERVCRARAASSTSPRARWPT